jgi:hypothetical protein
MLRRIRLGLVKQTLGILDLSALEGLRGGIDQLRNAPIVKRSGVQWRFSAELTETLDMLEATMEIFAPIDSAGNVPFPISNHSRSSLNAYVQDRTSLPAKPTRQQ